MATETITFSVAGNGFNSFHSFLPDWMIGMDNTFYTFKNGELYRHDDNSTRNSYYGTEYNSTITTIFNTGSSEVLKFNTLSVDGTEAWQADVSSGLSDGLIETNYFKEKEGDFYAYIRRDPDTIDIRASSTQGIGNLVSEAAGVLTFGFNRTASIAIGDEAHVNDGVSLELIGVITAYTATTITTDQSGTATPVAGNNIVVTKPSLAESFGVRGYYMETLLTNTSTSLVELFSVSSEAFKSSP